MARKPTGPTIFKGDVPSVQKSAEMLESEYTTLRKLTKEYEAARDAKREFDAAGPGGKTIGLLSKMGGAIKQFRKDWKALGENQEKLAKSFAKNQSKAARTEKELVINEKELIKLTAKKGKLTETEKKIKDILFKRHQQLTKEHQLHNKLLKKSEESLKNHNKAVEKYGSRWQIIKKTMLAIGTAIAGFVLSDIHKTTNLIVEATKKWYEFSKELRWNMIEVTQSLRDQVGTVQPYIKGMQQMANKTYWLGWGMEEASAVAAKLADNMNLANLTEKTSFQWIKTGVLASKGLGMGSEAAGEFTARVHKAFKLTNTEVTEFLLNIRDTAKATGVSSVLMAKDIQENMDVWSKYGKQFREMSLSSSRYARQFGISLKELLTVSEKFQNFETSAESVGKLNAVMGLNLNTTKMMMATETERAQILRDELMKAGKDWEGMSRFEKEAVVGLTGWTTETAEAVLSTGKQHKTLEQLRKEEEKRVRQQKSDAKVQKDANKALAEMGHVLKPFWEWSGKVYETWLKFGRIFEPVRKVLQNFGEKVLNKLIERFEQLRRSGVIEAWALKLELFFKKMWPIAEKLIDWFVTAKWEGLKAFGDIIFNRVLPGIAQFAIMIQSKVLPAMEQMWFKAKAVWGFISDIIKGVGDNKVAQAIGWAGSHIAGGIKGVLGGTTPALVAKGIGAGIDAKAEKLAQEAASKKQKTKTDKSASSSLFKDSAAMLQEINYQTMFSDTNINKSVKRVKQLQKYYDSTFELLKKVASYDTAIIKKAQEQFAKLEPIQEQMAVTDLIAQQGGVGAGNKGGFMKIGDISIAVADVYLDAAKVGKIVVSATRKS